MRNSPSSSLTRLGGRPSPTVIHGRMSMYCPVPPMAAIASAIHDATGVRMTNLPMNPGAVLEALWEKDGG